MLALALALLCLAGAASAAFPHAAYLPVARQPLPYRIVYVPVCWPGGPVAPYWPPVSAPAPVPGPAPAPDEGVTLDNRFNGDDTGISLEPVKPARPPTRPQPPLAHDRPQGYPAATSPSACLNAIVDCCPRFVNSPRNRERCLAYRGCPGPFWGVHPCNTELANEIIDYLNRYQ